MRFGSPSPSVLAGTSPFQPFCVYLEAVHSAVEHLELLGAVERKEGQVHLTDLGKKMASFPLEPRYAKVNQGFLTQQRFLTGCVCLQPHTRPRYVVTLPATFCRPSCCPPTTPVPRRFWASCLCSQWTPCYTTLRHGGRRCSPRARSSPPAKETTWRCSAFTGHSKKLAATRWGRRAARGPRCRAAFVTWFIPPVAGVVPRELCQQQEHESGEGNPGATQGYLSKGRHEHVKISELPS